MTTTDDLIDRLAADSPLPATSPARRFTLPLLAAMLACAVGVLLAFEDAFASVERDGMGPIMVKWGFSIALLLLCAAALWVLGRPGRATRAAVLSIALPFCLAALLLVGELLLLGPVLREGTGTRCLLAMSVMSPLGFAGAIIAMRALAPTDLRRAGLVAGLFGSAVAMTAYAPFCPERGMLFMTVFYGLPMLAMAGIGWLTGPRLLRW